MSLPEQIRALRFFDDPETTWPGQLEAAAQLAAAAEAEWQRERERLLNALSKFQEPMRRYRKHATWLVGDENMLIEADDNARSILAEADKPGEKDSQITTTKHRSNP